MISPVLLLFYFNDDFFNSKSFHIEKILPLLVLCKSPEFECFYTFLKKFGKIFLSKKSLAKFIKIFNVILILRITTLYIHNSLYSHYVSYSFKTIPSHLSLTCPIINKGTLGKIISMVFIPCNHVLNLCDLIRFFFLTKCDLIS